EQLLDTYLRYLQVINDLKRCGYKKDKCDVNDALGYKKKAVVITSDPLALVDEKTKEGHFAKYFKKAKVKDYNYFKTKMLLAKKDSDKQVLLAEYQAWIESSSDFNQEINANMVFMAQIEKVLSNSDESSSSAEETIAEITVHMIMPSKDNLYTGRKGIGFENPSYFEKAKDLRPTLYDEKVIRLGYTPMFLTHSDEALKIEKFKRSREDKIEFAYDYGNLNASYVNEKINFEDDYFQEIINPDFEKIDSPFQKTSSLKPYVPNVILERIIIDLEDEVNVTKRRIQRRPKNSGVMWKKKGSSNTSNVGLSAVSVSNLNKNVKRYSRKDLLACNNSHLGETSCASVCDDAMNVSCNPRMCDLLDDNNFFIFDDVNVRISPVRKMPFRKKPRDSMHVYSKSNSNKSLSRTVHEWLPTLQPLAEPIVQICLWIIDSGCSKHMTGLEIAFRKSTCFVRNEDGVDLLTGDRSSNLYTIALNEVASNSSTCFLAKASSSQSLLWHQRLSHLNLATINNLVKNNLVQGLPKIKFEKDHLCSACEQGKIHQKHHKSKTAFASNKPLYLLHMDLCGPIRVQSINGKRYMLVVVDDYLRYTWVFFLHSKDKASEVIISFIKKTQVNLQLQVQRVRTDNGTGFKNKTLSKFFDEVGITQQLSAARTPQQNGVLERRNRTLVEAARTMLTFLILPSFLWAEAIATSCFTQNRTIIHKHFDKTPYELINKIKPNIKFFRVFGCSCYLLNDYEDVGKLKAKGDIRVFVGYLKESAAFRIYNKQTRKIHESVNVNFDEISKMASKQFSLESG
nr:retrovirus-related Pol polyprotein from transposon TNT 1-94 [Tanacetum cinerariifolium]